MRRAPRAGRQGKTLFLHRARHCRNVVFDDEGAEDDKRQRADHRSRHQRTPKANVAVKNIATEVRLFFEGGDKAMPSLLAFVNGESLQLAANMSMLN